MPDQAMSSETGQAASWSRLTRLVILLSVGLAVVGVDQATKSWAIENLRPEVTPRFHLGGFLILRYAENPGAFGSLFGTLPDDVRWYVLTLGCTALLAGVAIYAIGAKFVDKPSFAALSLILAGGVGNLIDRFMHGTVVIDFLYIKTGVSWLHTNIFNIADVAITGGFIVLVVPMLKDLFWSRGDDSKVEDAPV